MSWVPAVMHFRKLVRHFAVLIIWWRRLKTLLAVWSFAPTFIKFCVLMFKRSAHERGKKIIYHNVELKLCSDRLYKQHGASQTKAWESTSHLISSPWKRHLLQLMGVFIRPKPARLLTKNTVQINVGFICKPRVTQIFWFLCQ